MNNSPLSNSEFQIFNFDGIPIRIQLNQQGEPLFVANDLCKALAIADVGQTLERLDDDEKGAVEILTRGGYQKMNIVTEAGMYQLIFRSNKPQAKEFKRWVTHDVLPQIRKTGSYQSKALSPLEILEQQVQLLRAQQQRLEDQEAVNALQDSTLSDHTQRLEHIEQNVGDVEYFTIIAYCRAIKHPSVDDAQARALGKQAAQLSREQGYAMGEAPHPWHGTVHTYHREILQQVFEANS